MRSCQPGRTIEYSARIHSFHPNPHSMKNRIFPVTLVSVLLGVLPGSADTITLKDGKILEGKIVRTEADAFVIEYNVTKSGSIKDTKRVLKSDVDKIVEVRQDEIAFAELAKMVPTPDLLTAEDYASRIQQVRTFLAKYPTGTKIKEANALLAKLSEEAKAVEGGGRKIGGLMVSGADYRANAYDMDAQMLEAKIRQAEKAGRTIEALRAFALLDTEFQASVSYRAALPSVQKMLQALRGQVANSLATFEDRMAKRATDLAGMGDADRANVQQALDAEAAELESRYQAEKAAGQQWVTPSANHRQSLEDCASLIDSEISRLSTPEAAAKPAADPGKAFRTAMKSIRAGDKTEDVEKAIADAQGAGLPEKYVGMLEEAAKADGIKIGGDS